MNRILPVLLYGSVCVLGVLVMVCGLGLAFGWYRASMFGFFGAVALLILLRLVLAALRAAGGTAGCPDRQRAGKPLDTDTRG